MVTLDEFKRRWSLLSSTDTETKYMIAVQPEAVLGIRFLFVTTSTIDGGVVMEVFHLRGIEKTSLATFEMECCGSCLGCRAAEFAHNYYVLTEFPCQANPNSPWGHGNEIHRKPTEGGLRHSQHSV